MFERYTRDRERYGAARRRCAARLRRPVGSVSFLYLYRRGNGRGTPDCREPDSTRVRFRGGCTAPALLSNRAPFLSIMSSFVSPLLEKETWCIFPFLLCSPRKRIFFLPFFLILPPRIADVIPPFEHAAINRPSSSRTMFNCSTIVCMRTDQIFKRIHCTFSIYGRFINRVYAYSSCDGGDFCNRQIDINLHTRSLV